MTRGETRQAAETIGSGLKQLVRQRWVRIPLILLALLLVARLALTALLAFALNRLAEPRDLRCDWQELELSLLSGRGELRYLTVAPRAEGAEPLLEIEYGVFDLELLALLRGELRLRRAEIDGLDTRLERGADGRWNIEQHVDIAEVLALLEADEDVAPEEEEDDTGLDLEPPIAVEALRLQHARLRIVDTAIEPPLDIVLEANARLSNLDSATKRPARFSLTVTGGELLDGATLEGEARWSRDRLDVALTAQAGGLRPMRLAPYLDAFDIRPAAESFEAGLRAAVEVDVVGAARDAIHAAATLSDVHLIADGQEALALDTLAVEIVEAGPRGLDVSEVRISGPRAAVGLPSPDALRAGGLDFLAGRGGGSESPAGWSSAVSSLFALSPPPAAAVPSPGAEGPTQGSAALPWNLERLVVEGGDLSLSDATVEPRTDLSLRLESFELGPVRSGPQEPAAIPFRGTLQSPGVVRSIALEGELQPFGPERDVRLDVDVEGIALRDVDPYLQRAGLQRNFEEGRLRTSFVAGSSTDENGRTVAWFEVNETALEDSGELFGVQSVSGRELVLDPTERLVRLGDIEIRGPRLALRLDPSNGFAAFGLRTVGRAAVHSAAPPADPTSNAKSAPTPQAAADPSATPATSGGAAAPAGPPPRIELGRLAWTKSDVSFVDEGADPPRVIRVGELGFELKELTLGGDPSGPAAPPASFQARLAAEGIAEELTLAGEVTSRPGPIDLEAKLALNGSGLSGASLAPYLAPLGITPRLQAGEARLDVEAHLRETTTGFDIGLHLSDGELSDAGKPWLALDDLRVEGASIGAGGVRVAAIRIERPFARIERDSEGRPTVAGLRLAPPPSPAGADEAAPPAPKVAAKPAPLELPRLPAIAIDALAVSDARIAFEDRALPLSTEILLDAQLADFATDGRSAHFTGRLALPDALRELTTEGRLVLGESEIALEGSLAARDWALGPFAHLAPAGLDIDPGGELDLRYSARVAPAAGGGLQASGTADRFDLRTRDAEAPWLAWSAAQFEVRRFDPVAQHLEFGPIFVRGAEALALRELDGSLRAGGLRLGPTEVSEPEPVPGDAANPSGADGANPGAELPAAVRRAWSHTSLGAPIELELTTLTFRDAGLGPDALPIVGSANLVVDGPRVVVDSEPSELPPLTASLTARLEGVVESLRVEARAQPFAIEPVYAAELHASGVRPQGVIERVPAFATMLEGNIEQGEWSGELLATLDVRRARQDSLGLESPFGADVQLRNVAYRAEPGGAILAGVDGVELIFKRIDLRRGRVHVESVDVTTPRGRVELEGNSVSALGVTWTPPASDAQEGATEIAQGPAPEVPAPEGPAPQVREASAPRNADDPAPVPPAFELRVDRVSVAGLDFEVRDRSAEPPLHVPLVDLDAELAGFSTRAWTSPKPMRFSGYLTAGVPETADAEHPLPVFEEVALSGRFTAYPEPAGWAQVEVLGLELRPFDGLARPRGLEIEDGAMTASARVRLRGADGAQLGTQVEFTDLDLEEGENGPLQSTLGLPVGLETALFLLRTPDGQHSFSFGVGVDRDGLSLGALVAAGARAFGEVVAVAVASAPFQVLGALVPSSSSPNVVETFEFAPGASELRDAAEKRLTRIAQQLESDRALRVVVRHELSQGDLVRADKLANPSAEECLELARSLREHKRELWERQRVLATRARTLYAVGADEAAEASRELAALEGELGRTESGLDRVLDVLRADSPRQQERRRRSVARDLADLRLESVRSQLAALLVRGSEERVDVRSPRVEAVDELETGRVLVELRR